MSFRKDSKKWKKTNKNLNKHKKQKQKGGEYNPEITGNFSTNEFFNYYLEKYSESIQTIDGTKDVKDVLFQPFDESLIKEQEQNILYVIDMQNDFIDDKVEVTTETETEKFPDATAEQRFVINGQPIDLYRNLGGPGGTGNFAVTEGNAVVKKIIDFIENNHEKFNKIIFTRDWHPRDHCSFNDKIEIVEGTTNTGHYPAHCVFNTLGACFAPAIKEKITYDEEKKKFVFGDRKIPIDIIFKGFHQDTDSYTAEKWPENEKYPIKPRQLSSCCPGDSCKKENTGGYKLNEDLYGKSNEMIIYDTNKKIVSNFEGMFDKNTPLLERNQKYNFYVVGLAGDFCVKDTAINLKNNYTTSNVYVIQELTRYVFIPAWVPLERLKLTNPKTSEPCNFENKLLPYGEWLTEKKDDPSIRILSDDVLKISDPTKALSLYMFDYDPFQSKIKRLDITTLTSYKDKPMAFGVNDNLWHFTTDHRTLVKDYYNNGVIILKSKPKRLLYGDTKFLVPTAKPTATAFTNFSPMQLNSTALVGGGRRRICSKKMIRKCKNKLTKKKRHSKQHSKCC